MIFLNSFILNIKIFKRSPKNSRSHREHHWQQRQESTSSGPEETPKSGQTQVRKKAGPVSGRVGQTGCAPPPRRSLRGQGISGESAEASGSEKGRRQLGGHFGVCQGRYQLPKQSAGILAPAKTVHQFELEKD